MAEGGGGEGVRASGRYVQSDTKNNQKKAPPDWQREAETCRCCGEPMGGDTGDACSFCITWGCADDKRCDEALPADPWLAVDGPIPGKGDGA